MFCFVLAGLKKLINYNNILKNKFFTKLFEILNMKYYQFIAGYYNIN